MSQQNLIFKYSLAYTDVQTIYMPLGSHPQSMGFDPKGVLCVWATVPVDKDNMPSTQLEPHDFMIRGTGRKAPESSCSYFGHVVTDTFVWHLFHMGPNEAVAANATAEVKETQPVAAPSMLLKELISALLPLAKIAEAYYKSSLDEHRPEWDPKQFETVELVTARGGQPLLTLADCEVARKLLLSDMLL